MADFSTILVVNNDTLNCYAHSFNAAGHEGAVSITGLNGIVVNPNPLIEVGTIGLVATLKNDTDGNLSLGSNNFDSVAHGTSSLAIGINALKNSSNGSTENTCIGSGASENNTSGYGNCSYGHRALGLNLIGGDNVAIGHSAGLAQTHYEGCTLIGSGADCGSNSLINAIAIGGTVDQSETAVIGLPSVKLGLGISAPQSELSFVGLYQQSAIATAHGSVTDLKKGQDVRVQQRNAGTGNITLFSLPVPIGNSPTLLVATYVKVNILFQSVRLTSDSAFGLCYTNGVYSIGVYYNVVAGTYSFIDNSQTNVPLVNSGITNPLSSGCSWQLTGNILSIESTTPTQFAANNVYSEVNYETFSVQQ